MNSRQVKAVCIRAQLRRELRIDLLPCRTEPSWSTLLERKQQTSIAVLAKKLVQALNFREVGNPSVTRPNGQRRVRCGLLVNQE
jgi:hypothetical protein